MNSIISLYLNLFNFLFDLIIKISNENISFTLSLLFCFWLLCRNFLFIRDNKSMQFNEEISFIAVTGLAVLLIIAKYNPTWLSVDKNNFSKLSLYAFLLVGICMLAIELIIPRFAKNDQ